MRRWYLIPIIIIGLLVLTFFPEPQTNFIAYVATMILLVLIVVFVWRTSAPR